LAAALSEKYGKPTKTFDFLHSRSIWKESNEFAMSLRQHERTLSDYWEALPGKLPDSIASIALVAYGASQTNTYLTLNYEFSNLDSCISHDKQKDKDAL
jgi:hypothetical protein